MRTSNTFKSNVFAAKKGGDLDTTSDTVLKKSASVRNLERSKEDLPRDAYYVGREGPKVSMLESATKVNLV